MTTIPPPADELRILDHELGQLDARRTQLLARRAWLVQVLAQQVAAPAQQPVPPVRPPQAWPPHPPQPRPESSPPSVQNLLLALGGTLLTVAAIAFTLVSWGQMGIAGRAAVLAAVTCAALGAPVLLFRRGLGATAEAVAALGLVLTVLDAYALHRVAFPTADGTAFAAFAAAALAALWTAYGTALPKLRTTLPAAVVVAQLPLPLGALAADASAHTLTAALLATAAVDTALALLTKRPSVRYAAGAGAALLGFVGLLIATALTWSASGPVAASRAAVLLLLATAVALGAALRTAHAPVATACAGVGGIAVVLATGGVLRTTLPAAWTVPAHLLCGIALLATLRTKLPLPVRRGLAGAGGTTAAAALLWTLPTVLASAVRPALQAGNPWAGAPLAQDDLTLAVQGLAVPVTLLALAAAVWTARRFTSAALAWRTVTDCAAPALLWAALTPLPVTLALPYTATLVTHTALAVASLSAATALARAGRPHPATTLLVCGLLSATGAALLSLGTRPATFTVLPVLLVVCAAVAALHADGARRAVATCSATALATALTVAVPAALELPPHRTALWVLAVPAATALLAARLRASTVAVPLEIAGALAATLAIGLSAGHTPSLALTLALTGVIATGTALRPDRRQMSYVAGALLAAACWVRLAAWDVTAPEAYTLPVTLPALAIGALRHRREPDTSSWAAYAPGLAATLLPSLVAAWSDPYWLRPLLLGAAALALTLLGARHRLQAPLALGGTVLALVAAHELAPYVVQVVGALPRWLPPALAGLLLLAVGATYEQRLRDARKLRDTLHRMH
ncbi:SCO7613 C-terminal domain-containing membrane protein [Streptomyces boluensis]|uniref:Uncharacterized protein n=1 Tax=Streptomyces boluensis TaxID=1775135 RepID=A0A964ULN0_9ACTN|nr:hypothetical protein [Streptomyces boluensis]NBE51498.1 hypothetical protein [Streptomyces boluensis]